MSTRTITAVLLGTLLAAPVFGQVKGFPIADSAGPEPQGGMHLLANGTFVSEGYAMGGRYAYNFVEDFRMFVDLGAVLPEDADDVLGIQVGGIFSIPAELPLDMGIRMVGYGVDEYQTTTDMVEEWGINVMFMTSGVFEGVAANLEGYFGIGANFSDWSQTPRNEYGIEASGNEVDFCTAAGLIYHANDLISLYGELGFQDEIVASAGFRFDF